MQRRAMNRHGFTENAADCISTQEFVRRVVQNGDVIDDHDFNSSAWISALEWLRRQGVFLLTRLFTFEMIRLVNFDFVLLLFFLSRYG